MTRQILIFGDNLTGLITAYRLLQYGFHITIINYEHRSNWANPETAQSDHPPTSRGSQYPFRSHEESLPLIVHGFYRSTWTLLQELSFNVFSESACSVDLEIKSLAGSPVLLSRPCYRHWLHPLARFGLCSGLSWSDRIRFINFFEKQWETHRLPDSNLDNQNVESWLRAAKQSDHSLLSFWNPLCRFFLYCDISQASLGSFIEVCSRYWFQGSGNNHTYLAPSETLAHLETSLREILRRKGVRFRNSTTQLHLDIQTHAIQLAKFDDESFKAQAYISTLPPAQLLSLIPERALARFGYFSALIRIPEARGLAVRFALQDVVSHPRLILNSEPFDWIASQSCSISDTPRTMVTCVKLCQSINQDNTDEWLASAAWNCIQNLLSPGAPNTRESSHLPVIHQIGPLVPCREGSRISRPIPQTPISNLFLAGPWTDTNLPSSLESTIISANAAAAAAAAYGMTH